MRRSFRKQEEQNMRVAFYTLGCKVNQYESNKLMEDFVKKGCSIVSYEEAADIYVINTCTVTHLADRKSRQYINRMKKLNPESLVAAIGCYVEVSPDEVSALEGVDILLGNKEKHKLPEMVLRLKNGSAVQAVTGVRTKAEAEAISAQVSDSHLGPLVNERTRAYIKIQEGCDRFCSYCIIPYARGPITSRSIDEILKEAEELLGKNYKELVLTGINTALYGADFEDGSKSRALDILVENLNSLPGDFRLRLGSLEPNVIDWRLAEKLLKYEKLCHHMHLSLQSGSDRILKAMNRRYTMTDFDKIVKTLRDADPDYGISTDIIVGFPGETEEDFQAGIRAVRENRFVKTHAFPYSLREGTKAAEMPGQIDAKIKKERNALMIRAGQESAEDYIKALIGKESRVLVEEIVELPSGGKYLVGHNDNYVKTYVEASTAENLEGKIGDFINTFVLATMKETYDDGVKAVLK